MSQSSVRFSLMELSLGGSPLFITDEVRSTHQASLDTLLKLNIFVEEQTISCVVSLRETHPFRGVKTSACISSWLNLSHQTSTYLKGSLNAYGITVYFDGSKSVDLLCQSLIIRNFFRLYNNFMRGKLESRGRKL